MSKICHILYIFCGKKLCSCRCGTKIKHNGKNGWVVLVQQALYIFSTRQSTVLRSISIAYLIYNVHRPIAPIHAYMLFINVYIRIPLWKHKHFRGADIQGFDQSPRFSRQIKHFPSKVKFSSTYILDFILWFIWTNFSKWNVLKPLVTQFWAG
jgi:hypothetical protein